MHRDALRRAAVLGVTAVAVWLILLAGRPGLAQQADKFIGNATLQLWPEYDDPGLLVIFSGELGDTVTLPEQVSFPLPAGARDIQAAYEGADGTLLSQPADIEGGRLTYSLPRPRFHAEYYVDRPQSGSQRDIRYTFEVPYPTEVLEIRVQQPERASGFAMTPQPEGSLVGSDGFTYYLLRRTGLEPGQRLDFTIRYSKPDERPSRAKQGMAPEGVPAGASAAPTAQPMIPWLPYVLIGLGVLALVGTGTYYWFRVRGAPETGAPAEGRKMPDARARRAGQAGSRAPRTAPESAAYCTQCGQPFRRGDRFCASCGAPRRGREEVEK